MYHENFQLKDGFILANYTNISASAVYYDGKVIVFEVTKKLV